MAIGTSRIRGALLCLACVVVAACDTSPRGPLADLAGEWSGPGSTARCSDVGPHGESLGPVPGTEYCEWVPGDSSAPRVVTGMRYQRRLASIKWAPAHQDSAGSAADLALLESSMKKRGIIGHPCVNKLLAANGVTARYWETPTLAVQLSLFPAGRQPRMIIGAIDVPSSIPAEFCEKH